MVTLNEEIARALIEDMLASRVQVNNPAELVNDVRVTNYTNGDMSIGVNLKIPMRRVDVTFEGSVEPQLVGCSDDEL